MNLKTYLKAVLDTDDIEEEEAITKAYHSECSAVKEAIAEFIYSKVKDTEDFKNFGIIGERNIVVAMESYLTHIYNSLRKRGRSEAKVESMFQEFQDRIGLTELFKSDVVGDKKALFYREWGYFVVQ